MLLARLAVEPEGAVWNAREASATLGLPLPMVSKILRNLARGKILASHRGASGGYSLERPARETSVAQVVRALEGPIALVQCGTEPGVCEQEPCCPTRAIWARISAEIECALDRIPITEMIDSCHDGGSTLVPLEGAPAN